MNTCPMCKYYTAPGWIINAWQIIPCFECNPGNKRDLTKPRLLEETPDGQIRKDRPQYRDGHVSDNTWSD